ncbi:MAG: hypothetical protein ABFS46_18940, partial [Myxococcota bacterium]
RFLTDDGEWVASFDSSQLAQSGQLPVAAEVELAFLEQDPEGEWVAGPAYQRRVLMPLRPFDLQAEVEEAAALAGGQGEEEEESEESGGSNDGPGGAGTYQACIDLLASNGVIVPQGIMDLNFDPTDALPSDHRDLVEGATGIRCP